MRTVLGMIFGMMMVGQLAVANADATEFDTLEETKELSAGQYVIDFTSDFDSCMRGTMNVTASHLLTRGSRELRFAVSEPVLDKGLVKPAVCIEGYNTAKAYINLFRTTDVFAPEGYRIKGARQIVQTTTVSTSDTNETMIEAGEYIVKIIEPSNCFEELNFNYDYSYSDFATLESVDVTTNGRVQRDYGRPCMLQNSEAVGTIYLPRGPVMLKTDEGSTMELKLIDESIIL